MAAIEGRDKIVGALGRWSPGDLAYLIGMRYEVQTEADRSETHAWVFLDSLWQRRDIVGGWPSGSATAFRVELELQKVSRLDLRAEGGPIQIMGFDIEDIEDISVRGWVGIRFAIEDLEDRKLSALCSGIRVLSTDRTDLLALIR